MRLFTYNLYKQKSFGPKSFKLLLEKAGSIQNIFELNFTEELADNYIKIIKLAKNLHFSTSQDFICLWEEDYPERLKEIPDPPILIFYNGLYKKELFTNAISIVGTRNCTEYGKNISIEWSKNLGLRGFNIVSGLALGIDYYAHKGCIESIGKTIAVLAGGVLDSYPKTNHNLYKEIISNEGLVVSEYENGYPVNAGMFVRRNRIVAGISLGTLVVEAPKQSGACITAEFALDFGREVFATPGNLNQPKSEGCNNLIKEGKAKLVLDIDDILTEFNFIKNISEKEIIKLTNFEQIVYDCLIVKSKNIEELSFDLKVAFTKMLEICTELELKGVIQKGLDGKYSVLM